MAVIIGNKRYGGSVPAAEFAHEDAEAFKKFVIHGLGFHSNNVIDLRDATQGDMATVLGKEDVPKGKLWRWLRPGESDVVVFYSVHGILDPKDGRRYLLPVDADPKSPAVAGFPLRRLYANLARLKSRSVSVFLETGFSGLTPNGRLNRNTTERPNKPTKIQTGEIVTFSAAGDDQIANWDSTVRRGLFTNHLLQGLRGIADRPPYGDEDGTVTAKEAKAYLDRELSYAARRGFGREQTAAVTGNLETPLIELGQAVEQK